MGHPGTRVIPPATLLVGLLLGPPLGSLLGPVPAAAAPVSSLPDSTARRAEPEMVLVPGGEFVMGKDGAGDASPAHRVHVAPFYLDKHEVTNAEYFAFCQATQRKLPEFWGMDVYRSGPGYSDHPVVGVSWRDATEYARWRGARLPYEAEWELAARGGLTDKKYSHGDDNAADLYAPGGLTGTAGPSPVASFPPNGYGLHDMTGNVSEWVMDIYGADYYARGPVEDPRGARAGSFRIFRGGGWHTGPGCRAVHYRNALPGNWVDFSLGFRCARPKGESAALAMERVFADSGLAGAIRRYWTMRAGAPGSFHFDESELDELGHRLVAAGRTIEALEVFRLVLDAWPDSPDAHASVAGAYLKMGQRELAARHWREALRIDPQSDAARAALEKLAPSVPAGPSGPGSSPAP